MSEDMEAMADDLADEAIQVEMSDDPMLVMGFILWALQMTLRVRPGEAFVTVPVADLRALQTMADALLASRGFTPERIEEIHERVRNWWPDARL